VCVCVCVCTGCMLEHVFKILLLIAFLLPTNYSICFVRVLTVFISTQWTYCGLFPQHLLSRIVEKNPKKFKIDATEVAERRQFVERAKAFVKVCQYCSC